MVQAALRAQTIDWSAVRSGLARCGELWGNPARGKWAIYTGNNQSGCGLDAVEGHYLDRFPYHFRCVHEHLVGSDLASLLAAGIDSLEAAQLCATACPRPPLAMIVPDSVASGPSGLAGVGRSASTPRLWADSGTEKSDRAADSGTEKARAVRKCLRGRAGRRG